MEQFNGTVEMHFEHVQECNLYVGVSLSAGGKRGHLVYAAPIVEGLKQ